MHKEARVRKKTEPLLVDPISTKEVKYRMPEISMKRITEQKIIRISSMNLIVITNNPSIILIRYSTCKIRREVKITFFVNPQIF